MRVFPAVLVALALPALAPAETPHDRRARVALALAAACQDCHDEHPAPAADVCPACHGTGRVRNPDPWDARGMWLTCQACQGTGKAGPKPRAPGPPQCPCNPQYYGRCVCPDGRCCCDHCRAVPGRRLPPADFELPRAPAWQAPNLSYPAPSYPAYSPPGWGVQSGPFLRPPAGVSFRGGFGGGGGARGGGC